MAEVIGGLPGMINNTSGVYEGDLKHYFKVIIKYAQNLNKPYHNFRHMLHVTWLCYTACLFYREKMTKKEMRNLLIAAMFHDFYHTGIYGDEDLNVERSIRGLKKYILDEDRPCVTEISLNILATQFPYRDDLYSQELPLSCEIIRDADMGQCFSVAWIQQVLFGLAAEWGKGPIEILQIQIPFLSKLKMTTEWGIKEFPQKVIDEKIEEVRRLIALVA
jgi:hypothetical protein